jgi:hypothetical protein
MTNLPARRYVSPTDAGRYFGRHRSTIYRWSYIKGGPIRIHKWGGHARVDLHYAITFFESQPQGRWTEEQRAAHGKRRGKQPKPRS